MPGPIRGHLRLVNDGLEFKTARGTFGLAEKVCEQSKSGAKDTTTQKDADVATLHENLLTMQNAADLPWLTTDPA